jgi:acetyltransferase-like isoleucine patch superfamily enzyme
MNKLLRTWYTLRHRRKFAKCGPGCEFPVPRLTVDGHVEVGAHSRFRDNCILRAHRDGRIIFGERCGLSWYVIIEATSEVRIGDFTGIAEFCVIRDTNHLVYGTEKHWRYTPVIAKPITIGSGCFIGSRCYIMPGVTIGDGAIIEAGSVVTKDVGPFEVWAGYPARRVGHRTRNIPESKQRMFKELVERYGIQQDRIYGEEVHRAARAVGDDADDDFSPPELETGGADPTEAPRGD